jgi:dTDP-4-dehydrorhamnose reductase
VVTGSSGLLGRNLVNVLKGDYEVVGISRHASPDQSNLVVDISQENSAVGAIADIAPGLIVHAAAETDVDWCETDRNSAWRVNVQGTANIVKGCLKVGAKLVFISTDYVFDGSKGGYDEDDQPNPVNFYGLTKLEAERVVAGALSDSLVVRTSVLYGWHPSKLNFATWILKGLGEHQTLRIAEDHLSSPTLARGLAESIHAALEQDSRGILHIAGNHRISRFDFALRIAEKFDLDHNLLIPVKMQDLNWIARRPRDSSLSVRKAEKELGIDLLDVDRGLEAMAKSRP